MNFYQGGMRMKIIDFNTALIKKSNLQKFYGTLVPIDWDENDTPIDFAISTFDSDIPLQADRLKKRFLKFLNKPVEVIGEGRKNSYGDEYIEVKRIKKMNFPEFQLLAKDFKKKALSQFFEYSPLIAKDHPLTRENDIA
jgi:hypothetical protein